MMMMMNSRRYSIAGAMQKSSSLSSSSSCCAAHAANARILIAQTQRRNRRRTKTCYKPVRTRASERWDDDGREDEERTIRRRIYAVDGLRPVVRPRASFVKASNDERDNDESEEEEEEEEGLIGTAGHDFGLNERGEEARLIEKSRNVIDLFERAQTPIGDVERAKAALNALQARTAATSVIEIGRAKKKDANDDSDNRTGAMKNKGDRSAKTANSSSNSSSGKGRPLKNAQKRAHSINHTDDDGGGGGSNSSSDASGTDFWSWTPPERKPSSSSSTSSSEPVPKLQTQTQTRIEQAVQVAERGVPQTLNLDFQSAVQAKASKELPLQFESETVKASEANEVEQDQRAPTEAEFATAVRELGADGETYGELSDGTRWWREAGTSELENGRICDWTLVRGQSADGSVEWEEKWWSTADSFDYKELGAIKSGRDGNGNVWQESWSEISSSDVSRGFFTDASKKIERQANKWGANASGAEWHEDWREAYWGDGVVDRECFKKSCVGKNEIPEDGHASRWNHNWKEKWDGRGGCMKTNDSWADRDVGEDGGSGRSWGERWSEKWGSYAQHGRQGEREGSTWNDRDGHKLSKDWGEEHYPDGRVRKYGHASDGSDHWDVWEDTAGWWERTPSFGWAEAVSHSPQLMSVKPRSPESDQRKQRRSKK